MGLTLSSENIATLRDKTEGWVAGLQLAALSLQDEEDVAGFIQAFAGSHHYFVGYLVEEVLNRRPQGTVTSCCRHQSLIGLRPVYVMVLPGDKIVRKSSTCFKRQISS